VILLVRVVNLLIGWLSTMNDDFDQLGSLTTGWVSSGCHFVLKLTTGRVSSGCHFVLKLTIGWVSSGCHFVLKLTTG